MKPDYTDEFIKIIKADNWMIEVLEIVRNLNLNDCWIGAGFIRNKIWDYKHGFDRTTLNDVDVIYFDTCKTSREDDIRIEYQLNNILPEINWSVKNQSRMNIRNGHKQYANCNEAISFWPETATSIAVKLNSENNIEYIAPYGLDDLFNLLVVPTPSFDLKTYTLRIKKKSWDKKWKKLNIKLSYKMKNT